MKVFETSRPDHTPDYLSPASRNREKVQDTLTLLHSDKRLSVDNTEVKEISVLEYVIIKILTWLGATDTTKVHHTTFHTLRLLQHIQDTNYLDHEGICDLVRSMQTEGKCEEVRDAASDLIEGRDLKERVIAFANKHFKELQPGFWARTTQQALPLEHPTVFGGLQIAKAKKAITEKRFGSACTHLTEASLKLASTDLRDEVLQVMRVLVENQNSCSIFERAPLATQFMRYIKRSYPSSSPEMLEAIILAKHIYPDLEIDRDQLGQLMGRYHMDFFRRGNFDLIKTGSKILGNTSFEVRALQAEARATFDNPPIDRNQSAVSRFFIGTQYDYSRAETNFDRALDLLSRDPSLFNDLKDFFHFYSEQVAIGKVKMKASHEYHLKEMAAKAFDETQMVGKAFHLEEEIQSWSRTHQGTIEKAAILYELLARTRPTQAEYWFRAGLKNDQLQQIGQGKEPYPFYMRAYDLKPLDLFFYNAVEERSLALDMSGVAIEDADVYKHRSRLHREHKKANKEVSFTSLSNHRDWYKHQRFTRREDSIMQRPNYANAFMDYT